MKAIIIGATSGIGRELAKQLSADGYIVGITGRRSHLLDSLEHELENPCFKATMDLSRTDESVSALKKLLDAMGDVDTIIINSGTGSSEDGFPLSDELGILAVNVTGFVAMANTAFHYFNPRRKGHIVGISSVAAERGGTATCYHASKAFVSSYLEGLGCRSSDIDITDIRPGFVDTAMAKGDELFWVAPVEKAAAQILTAIKQKHRVAYITKRWRLIALLMKCMPFFVYRKIIS